MKVGFYQAKLVIPTFTKGKKQLHPLDVESTRKIAHVRIHVGRVIGFVKTKFRIFSSEVGIDLLKSHTCCTIPSIDKIVCSCCALVNLCKSIIPKWIKDKNWITLTIYMHYRTIFLRGHVLILHISYETTESNRHQTHTKSFYFRHHVPDNNKTEFCPLIG